VDIPPDDPQIKAVIETQKLHMMAPTKDMLLEQRRAQKAAAAAENQALLSVRSSIFVLVPILSFFPFIVRVRIRSLNVT
jgi:hypothetical protein